MIEIIYAHKIQGQTLTQKKLSIGNGLPTHGQVPFVSLINEEVSRENGMVEFASMLWGFGYWIYNLRHPKKKIKPSLN